MFPSKNYSNPFRNKFPIQAYLLSKTIGERGYFRFFRKPKCSFSSDQSLSSEVIIFHFIILFFPFSFSYFFIFVVLFLRVVMEKINFLNGLCPLLFDRIQEIINRIENVSGPILAVLASIVPVLIGLDSHSYRTITTLRSMAV